MEQKKPKHRPGELGLCRAKSPKSVREWLEVKECWKNVGNLKREEGNEKPRTMDRPRQVMKRSSPERVWTGERSKSGDMKTKK